MPAFRPPTQSTCATFLPARSAAAAIVSAWRIPGAENDVRFENTSPERKNVLFVEPCSPDHVPVAIVYQPAPVLGGKVWSIPLAPSTPAWRSALYVGMKPASEYLSIRSGRIPSDEKSRAFEALPTGDAILCAWAPLDASIIVGTAVSAARTASAAKRLLIGMPPSPRTKRPGGSLYHLLDRA